MRRQPAERCCARKYEPWGSVEPQFALIGWRCSRRAVQRSSGGLLAVGLPLLAPPSSGLGSAALLAQG